ncbi:MAG: ABC transporter permease [Synergistaceae bacterium]|jgi:ribose/xylose/arabinose/galactoside ABC-type transport system permease subunit|nr:ABC transporter permease [Synergistaceae bacterium]
MKERVRKALLTPSAPIVFITGIVLLAALAASESFRSPYNLNNVMIQMAALGLVSLGQSFAVLAGDVDLCVGGVISVVTVTAASLMKDSLSSMILTASLALLIGIAVGTANGILTSLIKIDAMVTTFASNSVLLGLALWLMESPGGYIPHAWMKLTEAKIGFVPGPLLILTAFVAISWFVLDRTVVGFHIRAVGGGEQSAYTSGISVMKTKIAAHAAAGFFAALTGLYLSARMGSGDALSGTPFSLDSMTAVIAGGTNFSTGVGSVVGTTVAAFLITGLGNIFNHMGISTYWQYVLKGLLLVIAVTAAALRTRFTEGGR